MSRLRVLLSISATSTPGERLWWIKQVSFLGICRGMKPTSIVRFIAVNSILYLSKHIHPRTSIHLAAGKRIIAFIFGILGTSKLNLLKEYHSAPWRLAKKLQVCGDKDLEPWTCVWCISDFWKVVTHGMGMYRRIEWSRYTLVTPARAPHR